MYYYFKNNFYFSYFTYYIIDKIKQLNWSCTDTYKYIQVHTRKII